MSQELSGAWPVDLVESAAVREVGLLRRIPSSEGLVDREQLHFGKRARVFGRDFLVARPVVIARRDFLALGRIQIVEIGLGELGAFFQAKRDLFLRLMEGSRFVPLRSRGSYFQLMDYSGISDEQDADFGSA